MSEGKDGGSGLLHAVAPAGAILDGVVTAPASIRAHAPLGAAPRPRTRSNRAISTLPRPPAPSASPAAGASARGGSDIVMTEHQNHEEQRFAASRG